MVRGTAIPTNGNRSVRKAYRIAYFLCRHFIYPLPTLLIRRTLARSSFALTPRL